MTLYARCICDHRHSRHRDGGGCSECACPLYRPHAGLARKPLQPRRSTLRRIAGLRSYGAKAERERPAIDACRDAVRERSGGYCEVGSADLCGTNLPHLGDAMHHRCPSDRDRGVHIASRCVWLCADAHRAIHAEPERAYARGLLIRDGVAATRLKPLP